ncbi:MAG: hypothetical protein ACI4V1_08640, partial [Eubacteriales bacterium]
IREYFAESPLVTFDAWGTDPKDSQKRLVFIVLPQEEQDFARSNPVISFEKYRYTFMEYPYIHLIPWDELDTYRKLEQETNTSFDRIPYLEDGCLEPFAACNTDGIPDFKLKYTQACLRE